MLNGPVLCRFFSVKNAPECVLPGCHLPFGGANAESAASALQMVSGLGNAGAGTFISAETPLSFGNQTWQICPHRFGGEGVLIGGQQQH